MNTLLRNWGQVARIQLNQNQSYFYQDSAHRLSPSFFTHYQQAKPASVLDLLGLSSNFRFLIITIKENR